jgi:hypothetical protein
MACIPLAAAGACSQPPRAGQQSGWTAAWDKLLIDSALKIEDLRYDKSERLVSRVLGPGYRYHTKLRDIRAHPTRESLEYALYLLEAGGRERLDRALATVDRVIGLQDQDRTSKWYGIWGWYMEEPPPKMDPADWNWADFNGATLLLIELRHGPKLPPDLRARVKEAIAHCAQSIIRRNVSMRYTNIAVQGSFVSLAAGELLADGEIQKYARDRLVRLCQAIDETGSFDEYNSPTYARVTLVNLTRIRMYVKDAEALRRAALIEERLWLHLAAHWDAARGQFAGPMSRCYSTDLGRPLWLEKALDRRLGLALPSDLTQGADAETAIHDLRCPEPLASRFLQTGEPRQHHELYQKGGDGLPPVSGTCWVDKAFSLGSVNRGDFWNQRRPILAFFGERARPASSLTVRVIKDGYDFSSAMLWSVQQKGNLAGVVNFRDPGGDRHISLDMVKNGEFECGRLFVEFDFESLADGFNFTEKDGIVTLSASTIQARLAVRAGRFRPNEPRIGLTRGKQSLVVTIDLVPKEGKKQVVWKNTTEAWLAFTLELVGPDETKFTQMGEASSFGCHSQAGRVRLDWTTPAGKLGLTAATAPGPVERLAEAFAATIDGAAPPAPRLSEQKLG